MTNRSLLIVEDDLGLQSQLRWNFDQYEVEVADDRESAVAKVRKFQPAVVTLDLGLPPDPGGVEEGFRTLAEILSLSSHTKVIVITGNDDAASAVKSIGLGAFDFYQKPVEPEILSLVVERAFRVFHLELENRNLARQHFLQPIPGIIAVSPEMHELCRMVERLAPTDMTTLIHGESGTGKEVIAHALHALSARAKGPFVAVNSAAIPETLLEAELFGHEKGAFTGADRQVKGKFELADGGTFFLDEIGDTPLSLQPKLLRFLQEHAFERIGGRKPILVDVRVVCATHQDVPALIKEGKFREDLYYRISEVVIEIPPVRERSGDIPVLAKTLLSRFTEQMKSKTIGFSDAALAAMESYAWPGNVREMESRIKRAVIMSNGLFVEPQDLGLSEGETVAKALSLREVRELAERKAVCQALIECDGNVSKAADLLEVTRPTLYTLLNKFKLKVQDSRQQSSDW